MHGISLRSFNFSHGVSAHDPRTDLNSTSPHATLTPSQAYPPSSSSQPASSNTNAHPSHAHASPPHPPPPAHPDTQILSRKSSRSTPPFDHAENQPKVAVLYAYVAAAPPSAISTPVKKENTRCRRCRPTDRILLLERLSSPFCATRRG